MNLLVSLNNRFMIQKQLSKIRISKLLLANKIRLINKKKVLSGVLKKLQLKITISFVLQVI